MTKHKVFRTLSLLLITSMLMISLYVPVGASPPAAVSYPVAVDGRILPPEMTGDTSEWVEIAQNGNYSLIVRRNFININTHAVYNNLVLYNNPNYQYTIFGSNSDYMKSAVRDKINEWFNGVAKGDGDKLPVYARMRAYTHQVYPQMNVGTWATHASVVDGFSTPTKYQVGVGEDIAFALSYGEAASFVSCSYYLGTNMVNGVNVQKQPSNSIAQANYDKINMHSASTKFNMWLRTPVGATMAAMLMNKNSTYYGYIHSSGVNNNPYLLGMAYPAAWVDQEIFNMNSNRIVPTPIQTFPTGVVGRILTPDMSGDSSEWIEIAQNGGYSLIVRRNFINICEVIIGTDGRVLTNDPRNQFSYWSYYYDNPRYMESQIRDQINKWFNGNVKLQAETLPANARLRDYAVQTTVTYDIGTCTTHQAVVDGFSKPTHYRKGIGNDVAFALSYGESANFLSNYHYLRNNFVNGVYIANQPSNSIAVENYKRINFPIVTTNRSGMWLRSLGDVKNTVGSLENTQNVGRAFQEYIGSGYYGMVYPAMWVGSGIFGPTQREVTVVHYIATGVDSNNNYTFSEYARNPIMAMDGDILSLNEYCLGNFIYNGSTFSYDDSNIEYVRTIEVSANNTILEIFYFSGN